TSSITGSLLTGGVTNAIATTQLNLLNGTQGNANQAKTDTQTQFTFTAGQNAILSLTVAGFYEVYAATSNSTNSAQVANAHVALSFSVGNTSYSAIGTNGVSATVLSAVGTDGSTSPQSFAGSPYTFAVTAGQTYIFNVVEEVSANASAVPEPGTLALFGAGLAGLGFLGFRRQNKRGNLAA
ncbi:MAG TPA: PEP-CTERM sorting domain-containing protein, partial [Aliidongia sp.]|uniref:PEP-CTERM sorting domain-containing protein n=1 Tax=Aliidongia sp. TaxID=1914230 RepID=UPI002DDD8FBA